MASFCSGSFQPFQFTILSLQLFKMTWMLNVWSQVDRAYFKTMRYFWTVYPWLYPKLCLFAWLSNEIFWTWFTEVRLERQVTSIVSDYNSYTLQSRILLLLPNQYFLCDCWFIYWLINNYVLFFFLKKQHKLRFQSTGITLWHAHAYTV